MNSPSSKISRTSSRSSLYGEINAVIAIVPASTSNLLTSPIRRIFSLRSSGLKPKFYLNRDGHYRHLIDMNVYLFK